MIQIKHIDVKNFEITQNFILVKPHELEVGEEIDESGLILRTDKNTSIIDRPTSGNVIKVGPDVDNIKTGTEVVWVETDGLEAEFSDGIYLILKDTSIVGHYVI
jgi:co-chaperonin GroES (HSP10)